MFLNLYCTIVLVLWGETFLNISVKHVTSTVSIFTTISKNIYLLQILQHAVLYPKYKKTHLCP